MDNDVLRQAPLFSALDDEAATALRASMAEGGCAAATSSSTRATPATSSTSSSTAR